MEAPAFYFSAFDQQIAQNTTLGVQKLQQSAPSQRSRQSSLSSQRSISPRRSLSPSRTPLSEKDVAIGSIVFLPKDENTSIHCAQADCKKIIQDGAFEHPAVILQMWKSKDGELMTLACTMSGNPKPCPQEKARNLPISLQPKRESTTGYPTYHTDEVMYLEKAGTLSKQTYIQVKHVYTVPLSKLAPFGRKFENRLSQESYSYLMRTINLEKAPWIQTMELETGTQGPSTISTTPKAWIPTLMTSTKVVKPMAAFFTATEKAISKALPAAKQTSDDTPALQKGKKGKKQKFTAVAGHDFLSNMVCKFQ
ncbi:hypothetical protein DL95DRAFT_459333 [Leptodontidium sp. 2 PMI_412]|nr:hypothetical protein DL95DRAFT_459333 [Leptodontidium sp. 2 PMI_412]